MLCLISNECLYLRVHLHGTLERLFMEPFREGTDRLPVYTMTWNRSVQNRSFQMHSRSFTHEQFQTTASLSIHQEHVKFLKKFPHHTFVFRSLNKTFFESKFSSYRQLSSDEFPLSSFLSVPDGNGSGSLHENVLVWFRAGRTFYVDQLWYR